MLHLKFKWEWRLYSINEKEPWVGLSFKKVGKSSNLQHWIIREGVDADEDAAPVDEGVDAAADDVRRHVTGFAHLHGRMVVAISDVDRASARSKLADVTATVIPDLNVTVLSGDSDAWAFHWPENSESNYFQH